MQLYLPSRSIFSSFKKTALSIAVVSFCLTGVFFLLPHSARAATSYDGVVYDTDFISKGVGSMRNTGVGTITITNADISDTAVVTKAYLFWSGPMNSGNYAANASVNFGGVNVSGANIGLVSAGSSCWGYNYGYAYRADVTTIVKNRIDSRGSNNYALTNFMKPDGINVNGASLVVFFNDGNPNNNHNVSMYSGYSPNGNGSGNNWNVPMGINYVSGPATLQLHVSDGQTYDDENLIFTDENGTDHILAPKGDVFSGDSVPGVDNGPGGVGRLWDIKSYSLTGYLFGGAGGLAHGNLSALDHGYVVGDDCVALVAALVIVNPTPAPVIPPNPSTPSARTSTTNSCNSAIDISWSDPGTAVSYKLYRDGGATNILPSNYTGTSFVDTDVFPNSSHTYRVSAVNGAGFESAKSPASPTVRASKTCGTALTKLVKPDITTQQPGAFWGVDSEPVTRLHNAVALSLYYGAHNIHATKLAGFDVSVGSCQSGVSTGYICYINTPQQFSATNLGLDCSGDDCVAHISIIDEETTRVSFMYTPSTTGQVQTMLLNPDDSQKSGAFWSLDGGGITRTSGTTVGGVSAGAHEVYATKIAGYDVTVASCEYSASECAIDPGTYSASNPGLNCAGTDCIAHVTVVANNVIKVAFRYTPVFSYTMTASPNITFNASGPSVQSDVTTVTLNLINPPTRIIKPEVVPNSFGFTYSFAQPRRCKPDPTCSLVLTVTMPANANIAPGTYPIEVANDVSAPPPLATAKFNITVNAPPGVEMAKCAPFATAGSATPIKSSKPNKSIYWKAIDMVDAGGAHVPIPVGSYFTWTGTDVVTAGTENPFQKTYTALGTKTARVEIYSDASRTEPTKIGDGACTLRVTNNPIFIEN